MEKKLLKNSKQNPKIGILGGIGALSSAYFYLEVIKEIQRRKLIKQNTDYPNLIINSLPAPELIYGKESEKELSVYLDGIKLLDNCGCDLIIMVCNTIHLYIGHLSKKVKTPLLNLPDLINNYLKKLSFQKIAVLGTPSTIDKKLYNIQANKLAGITAKESEFLSGLIFRFNKGSLNSGDLKLYKNFLNKLRRDGADYIILGCTELELISRKEPRTIMPMKILRDYLIDYIYSNK